MRGYWRLILALFPTIYLGCSTEKEYDSYLPIIPDYFPAIVYPEDNFPNAAKIALGKKLFFDPILSRDYSISCSSCHHTALAFSDGRKVSRGVGNGLGFRNSMSLANVAYQELFFRDGGVPSLEMQILAPFDSDVEFNLPIASAAERLDSNAEYSALFQEAFGRNPDAFGLVRAIAAYERTLISANSSFDAYFYQSVDSAISEEAKRGFALFSSQKLACASCHSGFNFTDNSFQNNGLKPEYSVDLGRARVTIKAEDVGKFKVPTLRNIALTAPYMHDGSIATLEDVISHYESGGHGHPNQSSLIQGFELEEDERQALLAFLHSLSDSEFIREHSQQE